MIRRIKCIYDMEVIEGLSQVLTLEGRLYLFHIRTQVIPRNKHFDSIIKTGLLMTCKANITVSSDSHTKHKCNVIGMQNF